MKQETELASRLSLSDTPFPIPISSSLAARTMNHAHIDIHEYQKRLQALRDEILQIEQMGDEAAQTVELDQSKVGRLSRMDALQVQAMAKESQQRRNIRKQRIDTALERIVKGSFGLCVRCEEEIHPKRLEFDPTVLLCISCATHDEK